MQGRLHACKKASTQITAQHVQGQPGQQTAQSDTGNAAQQTQHQRLQQHQRHALARRGTQHGQQRKLRRALGHAEGQHRKHQKRPGEQSDQRQHREVDPVGARHLAHALLVIAGLLNQHLALPGGQGVQILDDLAAAGAARQQHIHAVDLLKALQLFLQRGYIHHSHRSAAGSYCSCNAQGLKLAIEQPLKAGVDSLLRAELEHLQGRRVEKHGIGRKQV